MLDYDIDFHNRSIAIAALDPAGEPIKRRPRLPCSRPNSTATAGAVMGYRVAVEQATQTTRLISFTLALHGGLR
jgi:hypothetical protein